MIEKFTKDIYKGLVSNRVELYQHMYDTLTEEVNGDAYWNNLKGLYDTLTRQQKEVFFSVIRQTMIDTISGVFGVLDGSSNLDGDTYDCNVIIDGVDMENDLQDYFLSYVEVEKETI